VSKEKVRYGKTVGEVVVITVEVNGWRREKQTRHRRCREMLGCETTVLREGSQEAVMRRIYA
jgi:hypothetical protein